MICEASNFIFKPPPLVSRARRVLIKPNAGYPLPYPASASRETMNLIIESIKQVSDADIIILEGTATGESIYPIYQALGYDFPRVLMLDVRDCIWVEVENPLPHPFAVATFWVPNVVLSSDYLVSVSPFKVIGGTGNFSIRNLLSLLPASKYKSNTSVGWGALYELDIDKVIADLYFTLPFDLGLIDARRVFIGVDETVEGKTEQYGKIFVGEPYEVDREAAEAAGIEVGYLSLIEAGKAELEA
ncbi:MAG: DUF362 domain-containing protein [Chloroflexi bacterium]|nr:DUF362 domain-containing protein [Chloroflexota bacterium]MBM3155402.1 DUF362 domain-containing protein [Chloroflexota bacterium]MBM3173697.1 DUF362 domain-containing protein [Chloroflexota bacterium]MBM3176055.1 DUF362 domain-containing protein [Chloroflexota bacterium]MBM4450597.1 DUF362 domain-containing protein [Chloroflexota bacterium]